MAPIGILLKTVFESILEVFLLCLAGYVLARRGILDKKTQKQLNRLNVSLFTPSLLFSKVAFFLSPAKLRELWIIPLFFVIVSAVSMTVAAVLGWLFRLKRSQRSFAMAASMFMNSNSLPIALMQSLVVTVPGLKWDDDDNKESMLGRALTYLVLYSTLGMVLRWSYGVHLLSQADPEGQDVEHVSENEEALSPELEDESSLLLFDVSDDSVHAAVGRTAPVLLGDDIHDDLTSSDHTVPDESNLHPRRGLVNEDPVFYSFPNTPTRSAVNLPHVPSTSSFGTRYSPEEDEDSDEGLLLPNSALRSRHRHIGTTPTSSRLQTTLRRTKHRVKKALRTINTFMTVPLWAAAASIVVALIQPLQHTLDDHLQWIKGALSASGNCSIPITLVVLGAYFYAPPEDAASSNGKPVEGILPSTITSGNGQANGNVLRVNGNSAARRRDPSQATSRGSFVGSVRSMFKLSRLDGKSSTGMKSQNSPRPGETRTVAIAVISRMFLTPLLLFPLMWWAAKYDVLKVFDDPIFVVSNVLLISSPPALTLAQITQAASGDAFERLISRTIFWAYCVVTPPSTIIVILLGLILAKL